MNCKKVEELLPLYVGRELEEESARLVTTHVRACSDCARCAREYSESTQLLQLFEPPQFSEATYVAVRSRVLREIEREASAPTLLQLLARLFQPRVRWAVSTAVLLAVCVFAYYFIANRTNGPQERANASSQPSKLKDLPAPKPDPTGTADVRDPGPGSPAGVLDPPAMATNSPRPRIKQTAWHSQRAGETPAVPVRSAKYSSAEPQAATPNASVTSEKTLRLEIQTSDRNIRIIWFSHPSTKEGSPNESSKGI